MTGVQLQLELFASSTTSSPGAAPSSPRSSGPAMSSCDASPRSPVAATATTATARAPASSSRAGATSAALASFAATSTAGSVGQPTLPMFTGPKHTPDPILAIPRPTTRGECLQEARPCPWASCRHHVLLEVAASKGGDDVRPTTLRLNRPRQLRGLPPGRTGRRPGLPATAAHQVVEEWSDDAVELLQSMRYTCVLDVAQDYPDGLTERSVGIVLGVSEKAAHAEIRRVTEQLRHRLLDQT